MLSIHRKSGKGVLKPLFWQYRNFENPAVHHLLCLVYNEYRIVTVVMHTSIDKKYNYDKNDNYI